MKRYPDGVDKFFFYEKNCPTHRPKWLRTARVASKRKQEDIRYCVVDSLPGLVWAANLADLEAHLAFLASVGSVSPYIGLLGTVWGIMNSFRGLSNVGAATLTQVAPGIAEALVATAIGLFAAIPAVVAYNRFAHDIDRLGIRFESFMEEFSNILQRNLR